MGKRVGQWQEKQPSSLFLSQWGCFLSMLLFAAGAILASPYPSMAANSLDILDRQREQKRPTPLSQPKIQITEDGIPADLVGDAQFTLHSLQIVGSTAFSEEELLAPYQEMFGSQITFARLYAITAELTKKYRDAGYLLSRVIIPEQEVDQSGATIRLLVVEGFIESIEYTGDARILDRFKSYFAPAEKRLVGRKPLKHSEFERYMLLMQDVAGITISSRFQKGTLPGGVILILAVQGDLVEGNLGWGNTGTEASGPGIASAGLSVNTLPVIGAQTALSYAQANNYREYWSVQIAERYQMWNGLTFNASYAYSDSPKMDTDFARLFDYTTQSQTFNAGASYPLIRSRDLNLSLGVNYEHRNSEADVFGERFTRDRLRTLSVNANMDFSDGLGGVTQIIPTLYRGLNVFDATDESFDASNSLAPAEFWKFGIYVSRDQYLPHGFSVFTAAEAQFSDASLSSYNRFYLGGSRFGRGYDPGVIEGDNGFAVLFEPRWTYQLSANTALQLFTFIDWGTVWTSESVWGVPDSQDAASAGAGIRLSGHVGNDYLPDFNVSAFIAQPLKEAGDDPGDSPRFVLQVGLSF